MHLLFNIFTVKLFCNVILPHHGKHGNSPIRDEYVNARASRFPQFSMILPSSPLRKHV